ncbi:PIR Superfamily Protein [Plasmodium ovale wallikeri]|uniref:PIR Superfamily Protein n=1 Tax=Plasmodium ovale wallikeri TaxID=864142 RepID=A0A1A9AMT5_PLAOA|nr:PIR Superfamily Protein [Plasmodium ovale wallikeri]
MATVTLEVRYNSSTVSRTWYEEECLQELANIIDDVERKIHELGKTGGKGQNFINICRELSAWIDNTKEKYYGCFQGVFLDLYSNTEKSVKESLQKCNIPDKGVKFTQVHKDVGNSKKQMEGSEAQNADCNKERTPKIKKCQTLTQNKKESHKDGDLGHQEGRGQNIANHEIRQTKGENTLDPLPNTIPENIPKGTVKETNYGESSSSGALHTEVTDPKEDLNAGNSEPAKGSDTLRGSSLEGTKYNPDTSDEIRTDNLMSANPESTYSSDPIVISPNTFHNSVTDKYRSVVGSLHAGQAESEIKLPSTGYSKPAEDLETAGPSESSTQHLSTVIGEAGTQVPPALVDTDTSAESQVAGANNERSELSLDRNKMEGSQNVRQNSPSLVITLYNENDLNAGLDSQEEDISSEDKNLNLFDDGPGGISPNIIISIILGILTFFILLFFLIKCTSIWSECIKKKKKKDEIEKELDINTYLLQNDDEDKIHLPFVPTEYSPYENIFDIFERKIYIFTQNYILYA